MQIIIANREKIYKNRRENSGPLESWVAYTQKNISEPEEQSPENINHRTIKFGEHLELSNGKIIHKLYNEEIPLDTILGITVAHFKSTTDCPHPCVMHG